MSGEGDHDQRQEEEFEKEQARAIKSIEEELDESLSDQCEPEFNAEGSSESDVDAGYHGDGELAKEDDLQGEEADEAVCKKAAAPEVVGGDGDAKAPETTK